MYVVSLNLTLPLCASGNLHVFECTILTMYSGPTGRETNELFSTNKKIVCRLIRPNIVVCLFDGGRLITF